MKPVFSRHNDSVRHKQKQLAVCVNMAAPPGKPLPHTQHISKKRLYTPTITDVGWVSLRCRPVESFHIKLGKPLQVELCAWRRRQGLSSLIARYKVGSMNEKQAKCLQRRLPLTLLQHNFSYYFGKCVSGLFRGNFLFLRAVVAPVWKQVSRSTRRWI